MAAASPLQSPGQGPTPAMGVGVVMAVALARGVGVRIGVPVWSGVCVRLGVTAGDGVMDVGVPDAVGVLLAGRFDVTAGGVGSSVKVSFRQACVRRAVLFGYAARPSRR